MQLRKYANHPQKFETTNPDDEKEWKKLKEVLCDNEYMTHYKIMVGKPVNIKTIFDVLTTLHTDTTNIYSHLIAAIVFFWRSYRSKRCIVNCLCGITFLISAIYHTLRNFSRRLYDITLIMDVNGIAIQIFAYLFNDAFVLFNDFRKDLMYIYFLVYTVIFLIFIISIPFILKNKIYWLRTFLCTVISFLCFQIMYHAYSLFGCDESLIRIVKLRVITFICQGIGLCFRSSHFPERISKIPLFSYIFHSHFFFHIVASIGSYYGCLSCEVK